MVFVGHRTAQPRLQPCPRHARPAAGADLRVGRGRRGAGAAPGVDRRPVAGHRAPSWSAAWRTCSSVCCRTAGSKSAFSAARRSTATATSTPRSSARTSGRPCGFPGSGGAAEIAIHARRTLVISRLNRRAFPERVDFVTSPGHRSDGRTRRELGHARGGAGPGGDRQGHPRGRRRDRRAGACALCIRASPSMRSAPASAGRCGAGTIWPRSPRRPRRAALLRDVLDPKRLYLKG